MKRLSQQTWTSSCSSRCLHNEPVPALSRIANSFARTVRVASKSCLHTSGTCGRQRTSSGTKAQGSTVRVVMKAGPSPGSPVPPPSPLTTAAAPPPKKSSWYQKLGQSFNAPGIARFGQLTLSDGSQALPHLSVPNISHVDWRALKRAGFEGCVFDKDNTLTEPYAIAVAPILVASLKTCIETFDGRVALLSNSAGLQEFDPEGEEAAKLEKLLGVTVLRHKYKKPEGGADELEAHFGCKAERLIMVGDRYLTDVVYGNKNGMLTIRPAPLTMKGEPSVVRMARAVEDKFVRRRLAKGTAAPRHALVASQEVLVSFVKAPEPPML